MIPLLAIGGASHWTLGRCAPLAFGICSAFAVAAAEVGTCGPTQGMTSFSTGTQRLELRHSIPTHPPLNQEFGFTMRICSGTPCVPQAAEIVNVEAAMPLHRHGMNRRSQISRFAECWKADGLVLHMPGRWFINVDLKVGGRLKRVSHEVLVD